jgi:dipeptidase E
MRLLLTSAGIKNASIRDALIGLLGKPIAEANALCIPTAMYGHPMVGPGPGAWRFISGREPETPMCELGWKSLGVLELTALPSIDEEHWVPKVRETDVLLVAMRCTCATGCEGPGWRTSCRRCARRSGWDLAPAVW